MLTEAHAFLVDPLLWSNKKPVCLSGLFSTDQAAHTPHAPCSNDHDHVLLERSIMSYFAQKTWIALKQNNSPHAPCSNDRVLLERCLATGNSRVIHNTVARIVPRDAALFLRAAVDRCARAVGSTHSCIGYYLKREGNIYFYRYASCTQLLAQGPPCLEPLPPRAAGVLTSAAQSNLRVGCVRVRVSTRLPCTADNCSLTHGGSHGGTPWAPTSAGDTFCTKEILH